MQPGQMMAPGDSGVSPAAYVTRAAGPTATGNFDITDARLSGITPKGALIIASVAKVDGTAAIHANLSYGVSDGTAGWVVTVSSEDGQTTTDTHRETSTSNSLMLNAAGTASGKLEAGIATMIDGGIRMNFTTVDDSNWHELFITVVFFVGDDFSCKAGSQDLGTGTSAITVSGVGFEPEVVLTAGVANNIDTNSAIALLISGVVHNGVSATEFAYAWSDSDSASTSAATAMMRNDTGYFKYPYDATKVSMGNFGADGFDVTPSASFSGHDLLYFALTTGGTKSWKVGTYSTPTSTGAQATTGVGFTPGFVLMGNTDIDTINSIKTDATAGFVGVSAWDDTNQYSNSIASEDAVTTSNTQSLSDNQALNLTTHDGTAENVATLTSLDADGWTLNFTTADASARLNWYLALEA